MLTIDLIILDEIYNTNYKKTTDNSAFTGLTVCESGW